MENLTHPNKTLDEFRNSIEDFDFGKNDTNLTLVITQFRKVDVNDHEPKARYRFRRRSHLLSRKPRAALVMRFPRRRHSLPNLHRRRYHHPYYPPVNSHRQNDHRSGANQSHIFIHPIN